MQVRVSAEQHIERLRFRRAPLAAASLWFALGIALARGRLHETVQLAGSIFFFASLAIGMLAFRSRIAWVPVAALWIAVGVAASEWNSAPLAQTALLEKADNLSRMVRGRVVRVRTPPPQPDTRDEDQVPAWEAAEDTSQQRGQPVSLDLAVDEIEQVTPDLSSMVPVIGGVRVSVYGAGPDFSLRCGERVEMPLRLKPPEDFRTPGAFDYRGYLLAQGIAAHAGAQAARISPIGASAPTLRCRLYAAQAWASSRLADYAQGAVNLGLPPFLRLSVPDALMLNAMLFGDRTGLNHTLRTGFERTGTFHLFVVSGLHLALVAAGIYWLLRRLRSPEWLATMVTMFGATAYAALTGFGQPAQRALTMTAVFLVARLLVCDRDALNALGAAILCMLAVAPSSLFDASFQMTVLVIVAIAGLAIPLAERTPIRDVRLTRLVYLRPRRVFAPRDAQPVLMLEVWGETVARILPSRWTRQTRKLPAVALRLALRACELLLISVVVELVMILPMSVYFHRMPIFSVPANVLILPAIALLVPSALLTFAASLVSAKLAVVPATGTAILLHTVNLVINRLSHLRHADVRIPGPVPWVAVCAVACFVACCWLVRRSRMGALLAAVALPVVAACVLWPKPALTTPGRLEITALDVGQGDSILAVNPEGETMLIDAGGPVGSHGSTETIASFDVGEQVVAPYLWSRGIRRLDVLVLSHAHTDHMGGMPAVLEDLCPRELWVGSDPASPLFTALLAKAASLGIAVRHLHAGDSTRWGSVSVEVLAPAASYVNRSAPRNDDSLVLHLQFGQASALLEGDAERPSEDAMLGAHLLGPVTLLKVGHHGSKTSSNPEFLAAVQPREAVISVGRTNTFGHPRAEVIQRFADAHTRLFRTDTMGWTSFLLARDGSISASTDALH